MLSTVYSGLAKGVNEMIIGSLLLIVYLVYLWRSATNEQIGYLVLFIVTCLAIVLLGDMLGDGLVYLKEGGA